MELLAERYGVKRFRMMPCFEPALESVPLFLLRRERAVQAVSEHLPSSLRIKPCAAAMIAPGLSKTPSLGRLRLTRTPFLPIRFPLVRIDRQSIAVELNQLLYHTRYRLLFMEFDALEDFYPREDVLRWSRLPTAAYSFRYSALLRESSRELMREMLSRGAPVVLGTGLNSFGKACYFEMDHYLSVASHHFTLGELDRLLYGQQELLPL